ncbi:hypothetical protein LSTR_LSTR009883 [Laodelphax striatellus]|uniref:Ig-like domain-containing protein n=1 Tax=Laodelphax striatellus TaxID=195883 RepID=A0A482WK18_LAOST|nr:hypothetical protein LSTR_LSTR009883 [Laodelphax striatellus]
MESPENKTNVRVLRNRVVDKESKDGLSTPNSKLGTPSKRGTPIKVAGEASGITTRTRRRLSTKLESDVPEPRLIMTKLPEVRTPSKRGNKNIVGSNKSPEVSQENITRSTRKDSKKDETSPAGAKTGNLSMASPQNRKDLLKDQSSPVADEKVNGDLSPILENGENSDPLQTRKQFSKNQSSPKADNKAKGDLPPILENVEDSSQGSDNSIIENSFQLEFNVTDKTKNEVQKSPSKRPLIDESPDKTNREETIQSPSPKAQGKKQCGFIVQEEESIKSVDQGEEFIRSVEQEEESNESVDQEKGSSEIVDQANESSTSVHQEEETNAYVNQEDGTNKFSNQVEKSSVEEESDESINQEKEPSEIFIEDEEEECSNPVDQGEESSSTLFIEKESSKPVDQVNESICPVEFNSADSAPNAMVDAENSSIIQSSPSKKCGSSSEKDSNVIGETVATVEDDIPLKGKIEDESNSNNVSFELVEKFQDTSAVNTSHDDKVDDDTENSTQPVADQLECKKLSESSPSKVAKSPKSSPSKVCSPRKHSSAQLSKIGAVLVPMCQRLPTESNSPSKSVEPISAFPEKVVCNKDASGRKVLDSDSDSDDSDLPLEIPSKDISQKKSPHSTDSKHVTTKLTPSPNKVLKIIKPVQSEKLYEMKTLIKSIFEAQPISNPVKTLDESQEETSTGLDELRMSRKEWTLIMKEAFDDALVPLRNDILEIRKELSDLKTLRRKEEEEKSKHLEENMEECPVLVKRKKDLVVEHLLAKQAAQIFSDRDSPSKKKKSPKKNKESTQVAEEMAVNSGSESCSTLPVTHQPKLKKRKKMEVEELEEKNIDEGDDYLITNVEVKKKRKRKKKTAIVGKTEETPIETTHVVEPVEQSSNSEDDLVIPELKPKKIRKRKRSRKHENTDQETHLVESTVLSQVNPSDALENLSKKSKKKQQSELFNEDCMNVDNFDHQTISEKKKDKKHKKKDKEQMDEVSSNVLSFNIDRDELEQPVTEEKKKKKKHVQKTDELHSTESASLPNLDSNEFEQQTLNEVKKKKKKRIEQIEEVSQHLPPKNITSPNQNPLFGQLLKIKKQKLKKNLKPKSNLNISQQHLKSYMEEFCDFKPKDNVKLNSFGDGSNEPLKSKDTKKLKKKNKVNDSVETETGKKDGKHSKKEKDSSHKLTPSATLDVTNFWLRCGGENGIISSLGELHSKWFKNASEVTDLDLSENNLTHITANLPYLPNLLKLDLSRNRISKIDLGAFSNLTSLKTLDLSFNRLKHLSRAYFEGLSNLERLRRRYNQLSQIKEGTFDDLVSLKKINLTMNALICDCSLWWLPGWARNQSVKLTPLPKCSGPASLRGQPLRKLKPGLNYSYCDWPHAPHPTSFLELRPDHNQVVFEGDSLKLQCRVVKESASDDSVIYWKWAGLNPIEVFDGAIIVTNRSIKDSGLIESVLQVEYLTSNYSGQWDCHLSSSVVNQSTSVAIVVITEATNYCPMTTTTSNRGRYVWPKTIANNVVELPCAVPTEGDEEGAARHACNETGHWSSLDTSACPFASEVTRTLYQFSQMNTSLVNGNALETINKFSNYTNDAGRKFTDEMDIIFITRTVKNYLVFVKTDPEVGKVLLDIVHGLMQQPRDLLLKAQQLERSTSILVSAIEDIVKLSSSFQWHSTPNPSLLVEGYAVSWGSFQGLSCTRYGYQKRSEKVFKCSTVNNAGLPTSKDMIMEASVRVHPSLFHHTETKSSYQLMISMFENSKLFPRLNANDTMAITTSVIGVKIADVEIAYLAEPVFVMLQLQPVQWTGGFVAVAPPRPVWWDAASSQWRDDVCKVSNLSHVLSDVLVFQCYKLGYFAVLQDVSHLNLRLAPPAVYVGTFIGATCMLVATISYAFYHTCIQMPTKAKHSLANTWLAMALLFITYSVGIYQTEDRNTCQIIGLMLHYLTLCSLFWMALTINGLYKRVCKREPVGGDTSGVVGVEGEEVVVGQPLVGVYLVGWGIALLVCGLSGAVNLRGYAATSHCSLGPGPGVSALLFPAACLLLYLLLTSVMVRCAALSLDSNAQLSEGTQATDLELLDNDLRQPPHAGSVRSVATPSSQLEDPEHSPACQLKAFLIVLILFLSVWTSSALATLTPFHLPYEETLFSVLYAVLVIMLGMFVVFFHCFAREDVRLAWFTLKPCCRSRNVTDSRPAPPPLVSSSDSLNSSSGRKSAATGLNSTLPIAAAPRPVDLMLMHRRHYRPDNIACNEVDVFYNPHQIGVARKFFKKQRRKQNNLIAGRRSGGDGASSPVPAGLLGGGSAKVNNTNLHVEPPERRSSNPNLLSASDAIAAAATANSLPPITSRFNLNNNGSIRSTEDQLTSVVSSCGGISGADTDCGRDISCQQSCGSSHIAVSDQSASASDGSHLYATIDPPSPRPQRRRTTRPPLPPKPHRHPHQRPHSDSENRCTDDSTASKRETSV